MATGPDTASERSMRSDDADAKAKAGAAGEERSSQLTEAWFGGCINN